MRFNVLKAYQFRLNPTEEQLKLLYQHAGNCRFLWNYLLTKNKEKYAKDGKFIFAHEMITSLPQLKKELPFLEISFSQSLQQVAMHLDKALKDAFNKSKGFPNFHKKASNNDSFTVPQKFRIEKRCIFIPKIGKVKMEKHREIKGKIKHVTISLEGDHFVYSVCVEIKVKNKATVINLDKVKGIDVGLKNLATLSDGDIIENPHIQKKYQKKLKREQKKLSRRKKGGKNKEKQRKKVAKAHQKVKNVRKDYLHKESSKLIAKADGFIMEDLHIKGMLKNHHLAKAISDASLHELKRQLKYKCFWNNKYFAEIDRFEPSSKKCSCCGWINENLCLKDREFFCQNCGLHIDRDLNAAINIRKTGLEQLKIPWGAREFTLGEIRGSCHEAGACRRAKKKKSLGLSSA